MAGGVSEQPGESVLVGVEVFVGVEVLAEGLVGVFVGVLVGVSVDSATPQRLNGLFKF